MSKGKKRSDIDDRQLSLFDLLLQEREDRQEDRSLVVGSLNIRCTLRSALSAAIQKCSLSRYEIAGRMSALMDQEISKFMIDAWLAESKEGHRFPAEHLPAFCEATGCHEPLRILAEKAGMFALPGPEALRAEIQRLDEETKKLGKEKRKRVAFLEEMES